MASQWLCSVKNQLRRESRESRREKGKPFCKVPAYVRRGVNKKEYEPIFFSFGPYHAKLPSPACDHFKLQAATALTSVVSFDRLVEKIKAKDSDIRDLYAEPWDHMREDQVPEEVLAHLLAFDALTIVAAVVKPEIFQPHTVVVAVFHDAWLLDNQLPLFVLQYAIESIDQFYNNRPSLESVIRACAINNSDDKWELDDSWSSSAHVNSNQSMIGCVYDILTTTPPKPDDDQGAVSSVPGRSTLASDDKLKLPTASQLQKCGIKFAACNAGGRRFTRIGFNECKRVLILPKITLYDITASYLLNLAAYEVSSFRSNELPVVSYIEMMDDLVNEAEDVRLLGGSQLPDGSRVIENELGSDEKAAFIWNKMSFGLPYARTQKDKEVIKKVNEACKSPWHKVITGFRDEYLNKKPWLLVSIISAFILLVLTFLQTIYSMQLYYLQ